VENNVVYNTLSGALMYHNGGHENRIFQNVFAFCGEQMLWPCWEARPNQFCQNILYITQGTLFIPMARNSLDTRIASGGPLGQWDYNLYFDPGNPDLRFFDDSFEDWQATGLDEHSVIADPLFADPERYDFRLRRGSPAAALGIRSIDASKAGLYGDEAWVAEARRYPQPRTVLPVVAAPAGPTVVDDGFESIAAGDLPANCTVNGEEKGASIRVSDEQAATGKQSLKFTDAEGLAHEWQPHMYCIPRFRKGTIVESFDILLRPGATLYTEWRDVGKHPECVGPSITFDADGGLRAAGRRLTQVPHDRWVHVSMQAEVGTGAPRCFSVTVQAPGSPAQSFGNLQFSGSGFKNLNWLGFVSMATTSAEFYVDNVMIGPISMATD